jgi:hypothetical protein
MLAKLAFIASGFDAEEVLELAAEMGTSEQMLFSLAVDYKALECTVCTRIKTRRDAAAGATWRPVRVTPELRPLLLLPGTLQPYFQCLLL